MKSIGERIAAVRGQNRLGLVEFAQKLGIHKNTLSRYEKGHSPVPTTIINKVATTFDVSALWIMTGEGAMQHQDSQAAEHADKVYNAIAEDRENYEARRALYDRATTVLAEGERATGQPLPTRVATLVQELIVDHGLTDAGALRLIESLARKDDTE